MTGVRLTPAQRRILPFIRDGLTYAEIGKQLGLSAFTVKNRVYAIVEQMPDRNGTTPYAYLMHCLTSGKLPLSQ